MSDSTSILDLPTDPVGGGSINNNISLSANESITPQQNNTGATGNLSLDQTTINQIVNGLQQASLTGATQLPSRDIPINTNNITTDPHVQPNYVPVTQNRNDYIQDYEQTSDAPYNYNTKYSRQNSLDEMYNEIQMPLLLAVLYFLFQLPFFKNFLYTYFPVLFSNDGNYNINGFLFTSILFSLLFYSFTKITTYFHAF